MWKTWTLTQKSFNAVSTPVTDLSEHGNAAANEDWSRRQSAASATSKNSVGKALLLVLSGHRKYGSNLQLAFTMLMPIAAISVLCALTLKNEVGTFKTSQSLSRSTYAAHETGQLVTQLQKERGMTCVFLSTERFDSRLDEIFSN